MSNSFKVVALRADDGGCARYRIKEPARTLSEAYSDIDIEVDTGLDVVAWKDRETSITTVERIKTDANLIVIQRPLHQWFTSMIEQAHKQGIAVVVELDDDFENVHPKNVVWPNMQPRTHANSNYNWVKRACELADHVTISTEALRRYAPHGRVSVVPNYISRRQISKHTIEPVTDRPHRIGWSGTVQTHPTDLQITKPAINQVLRDTGSTMVIVGDGKDVRECLGVARSIPFKASGWVDTDRYMETLCNSMDIGIVPLEDSKFNDAKCLDKDTKIATHRGVVSIGEIVVGDQVLSRGEWKRVNATSIEPPEEGIELTTASGRSVKLSHNHRLLVNESWTEGNRIKAGDVLHIQPEKTAVCDYVRAPWPPDGRKTRSEDEFDPQSFISSKRAPSVEIDEVWARFMGLFVGDGCCSGKSGMNISCDGQDSDLIQQIADDIRSFGLRPLINWSPLHRRAGVGVTSAHLNRFFESLGLVERKDSNDVSKGYVRSLRIPQAIWQSPKSVLSAFLAGLFEADGTAGNAVSLTTKSIELARDVQHALLFFGISSRIKPVKSTGFERKYLDRTYYIVTMNARASTLFEKEIGFLSTRKYSKMSERSRRLAELSGRYGQGKPQCWTDEIVSVQLVIITPVDIQVDGEQFSASGITSHNSHLKGLEFAACGIPFVASPTPEYRKLAAVGVGKLASTPSEWRRLVSSYVKDESMRVADGEAYRSLIRERFVLEDHVEEWIDPWRRAIDFRKRCTKDR